VFHIGFFKQTLAVLSCICKTCSRVLLSESESARFYMAFRRCEQGVVGLGMRTATMNHGAAVASASCAGPDLICLSCSTRVERQSREAKFKELLKKCKLVRNCPHCGAANGPVK
jgi:DNA-directed RNA polymerase III subunit RPC1